MLVLQRRQPIALVLPLVFGVADADTCLVEQIDGKGGDLAPSQRTAAQVNIHLGAQLGQSFGERQKAAVLSIVAYFRPVRVIDVLLAALLVTPRDLDMPMRDRRISRPQSKLGE